MLFNGTYWITPTGTILPVNVEPFTQTSHEEYAEKNFKMSLEKAFFSKYIRVQAFENHYLFIDHRQKKVLKAQIKAINQLLSVSYNDIIVERKDASKQFDDNQKELAYNFILNGD